MTLDTRRVQMRELSLNEVGDVNGGGVPLVFAILATDTFLIGFTAGAITGYATVKSLFK